MPRLQANISFTAEDYELVKAAADARGLTVTQFARAAIMEAAQPMMEVPEGESGGFPTWLLALLALLRTGHRGSPRDE